ncbi:AAA family ATPase [Halococcus sp. AFM35]|uniref:AAA family ATPase n=1 Tax=Halococcus sp. AFM35 TaxID=3421653 RepID=UPI003EB759E9
MQFARLTLDSFKCFEDVSVEFDTGVTVIHGPNGAGKSSLLEACFFALYGSEALPDNKNLNHLIEKGETEAAVQLWFVHGDHQYRLERSLRYYPDSDRIAHEAELQTPTGTEEGVGQVDAAIEAILRMDADAFLNCAYVRQGDINKLITADPETRQNMIDELLQLGKLEEYRERMDNIRIGVDRVRRDRAAKLENVHSNVKQLKAKNLDDQHEEVEDQLKRIDEEVDDLNERIDDAEEHQQEAIQELEEQESLKEERDELKNKLSEERKTLEENKQKQDALQQQKDDHDEAIDRLKQEAEEHLANTDIDELDLEAIRQRSVIVEGELDELEEQRDAIEDKAEEFEQQAKEARETAVELEEEAENLDQQAEGKQSTADEKADQLDERREKLSDLDERMDTIEERFAESPATIDEIEAYKQDINSDLSEAREKHQEVKGDLSAAQDRVQHAEELLEEGRCPECGQSVEDAPDVSNLDDLRDRATKLQSNLQEIDETIEQLESDLKTARNLEQMAGEYEQLTDRKQDVSGLLEDLENTIESLREEAREYEEEAEEKREEANTQQEEAEEFDEQAEQKRDEYDNYADRVSEATAEQEALERAETALDKADRRADQREQVVDRLGDFETFSETNTEEIERLESEIAAVEEKLDPERIQHLEDQRDEAEQERSRLNDDKQDLVDERNDLQGRKGAIKRELEELNEKREREAELQTQVKQLETAVEQCETTEEMYRNLRHDLRVQNVRQLEEMLNEMFGLVYQNDTYARLELSDEYELTIYEKSGETLEPTDLSGGERALFNLSLRCAIYQLLSVGISGQAPLPPLILDEPTVHLDEQHVNEISTLVTRMRDLGVEQTIVVSHEEEIVDSADERLEVMQNATTNRSRVRADSLDLLA